MYVITGATGNIGSKAADILLDAGEKVRVVGRNAASLQRFVDRGAEAAVGNLKDGAFVARAFTGATAVFAMIPPDYTARDFRAYQNEIGTSLAGAIRKSGVDYVVNLSSQGADLAAGTGPILGLRDQEERLNRIEGVHVLHLRCTYFMENLLMSIPVINQRGFAASTVRGDQEIAMIATCDIAAFVAWQLVRRDFEGKMVWDLLGQRDLSLGEAFGVVGAAIGKPDLKYVQFSDEDAGKWMREMGISADATRLFIEMSHALNEGRFGVELYRTAESTTTTSIEDFAATFSAAFAGSSFRKAA
jgi:uncharacterized protein YbjT (DUF2867 family)